MLNTGLNGIKNNLFYHNKLPFSLQLGSYIHLYQVAGSDVLRIKTTEVHLSCLLEYIQIFYT